ncbi:MAG TPA: GxxExxY protein [Anaerolineaceae bacterium]
MKEKDFTTEHTERKNDREAINRVTEGIIGAAIQVHRSLGPGLLESAYEACLAYELKDRGWIVEEQKAIPLVYREVKLDCGYRLDLLVQNLVIVEIKAVDEILPIHRAQIISYLRLSGIEAGLLLNFNVKLLKNGIERFLQDH